jgi:hypothetical protein
MKSSLRLLAVPVALGLVGSLVVSLAPFPRSGDGPGWIGGPSVALARLFISDTRRILVFSLFEPAPVIENDGRQLVATGPFACEPGAIWRVDVEITQDDVVAEGHTQGFCSGNTGMWEVQAVARGPETFFPGPASGCGRLVVIVAGRVTDSQDWCSDFTLEAE